MMVRLRSAAVVRLRSLSSKRPRLRVSKVAGIAPPQDSKTWLVDEAKVLARPHEINALAAQIYEDTGSQVAVALTAKIPADTRQFAMNLFDSWGVGSATWQNGLLIVVFTSARGLELRTGKGMKDVCTDDFLKDVVEVMTPFFRKEDYDNGLKAALELVGERARARAPPYWWYAAQGQIWKTALVLLVVAGLVLLHRFREKDDVIEKCATCGESLVDSVPNILANVFDAARDDLLTGFKTDDDLPMPPPDKLPEDTLLRVDGGRVLIDDSEGGTKKEDNLLMSSPALKEKKLPADCIVDPISGDVFLRDPIGPRLSDCGLLERRLGSAVFRDLLCARCGTSTIRRQAKASSPYEQCAHCGCCAATRHLQHESPPTQSSPGFKRYTRTCLFCQHKDDFTIDLPILSSENKNHDRQKNSFAGGNTSDQGGGASASW